MDRPELTDAQWETLRLPPPPQKPRTGRPANDHRTTIGGILWVLRTGSPWRSSPERYGSWKTVTSRFYRWHKAGIWDRVLAGPQQEADARGRLDRSPHFVDRTVVGRTSTQPGPKGGCGGRGAGARPGWRRHDSPPAVRAGRQADGVRADRRRTARAAGAAAGDGARGGQAPGRGRPRVRPDRVAGDRGYSSPTVRRYLKGRGIGVVIPTKTDEAPDPVVDRDADRERNVVERRINRLRRRRIATRHEKRAANYLAMLTLAAALLRL